MMYIILLNLLHIFFFIYLIIKHPKNIFIYYLAISNIEVYCTIIISNILNKADNYMELKIVKSWLI